MKRIRALTLACLTAAAAAPAGEPLVYEAEWAHRLEAPAVLIQDPECSGGLAVCIPDGSTEDDPVQKGPPLFSLWLGKRPVGYNRLWARVKWESVCGNSFVCAVSPGGFPRTTVTGSILKKWYWVLAGELKDSGTPATLMIWNREDGIAVDQFALLPNNDPPSNAALPSGHCPVIADDSVPLVAIFFTTPMGRTLSEDLAVHPTHLVTPNDGGWARHELFVMPEAPTRTRIWLRNTKLIETNVTVIMQMPAGLKLDTNEAPDAVFSPVATGGVQTVTWQKTLKPGEPLLAIPLAFSAGTFPQATRSLRVDVQAGAVTVASRAIRITRPLDWMIMGPIPGAQNVLIAQMQSALMKSGAAGSPLDSIKDLADEDAPLAWIRFLPLRHLGGCGRVDMEAVLGKQANCCAFAYTWVDAASFDSFPFLIENDDGIHVWVNGKETESDARSVPAITSRRQIKLPLVRGRNLVAIRIDQVREHWQFRLSPDTPDSVQGVPFEKWK